MTIIQVAQGNLGDIPKALLTAGLALSTLLLWELWIKPARTKLNVALVLIAELELNLEEIAYFRVCREEDPENQLVNLMLPRASFAGVQSTIGELSPGHLRDVIRFYALTSKIEATLLALTALETKHNASTNPADRDMLSAATASGIWALGRLLDEAWDVGERARRSLDVVARRSSPNDPPPIEEANHMLARAKAKRTSHV